jgi:S1-C subfamily serine protease
VASAKEFYRQVSRAALPYAGVLIFAFKGDATHPFLQPGDIIVGYNGKQTKSYNDLKAAFKEDNTGTVTYLRLVDGDFEELTATWEETGIVGFLDLTE